jgi:nicotinamide phosphoribosyltransferase
MKKIIPTLLCDFYKVSHMEQYPNGTEKIYSTWTPRMSRLDGIDKVVAFGYQGFVKEYLIDFFNNEFFSRNVEDVCAEYERYIKFCLGVQSPSSSHISALHNLGYLPIKILAVPEGMEIPLRTPMLTIENTNPEFFWLTNYLESLMSTELWSSSTSATIANQYRKILNAWAIKTTGSTDGVNFQGHDFSFRGMGSTEMAMKSGAGHLLSFDCTDTIPSIMYLEQYYSADIEKELVGASIPATEHSVQCVYADDYKYFETMITEVYPSGFASIVSDGYDYWEMLRNVIPSLKDKILARDGKTVIRPDSGDPIKIICGDVSATDELVKKGTIEVLWDIFGGTINKFGYKILDSHIGAIYGDSITIQRADEICKQLESKGFASTNIVFGIGSYTYQYNTRDTFGFAMKATYAVVNGEERLIYKDPKTDDGTKKSQRGLVVVYQNSDDSISYTDNLTRTQLNSVRNNLLQPLFEDGELLRNDTLANIRTRIRK